MRLSKLGPIWLSTLFITLANCSTIRVPSVEWCASRGGKGALCQDSHDKKRNRVLTLEQWYDFLTPKADKGPALCLSSEDFSKNKTAIEQMCARLKDRCTIEMKKEIQSYDQNIRKLQTKAKQ